MMTLAATMTDVKVADEVWIAAAHLHREHPSRADFTIEEIVGRVRQEDLTGRERPGVYAHVVQHCVANRRPNSGRYRMLYETAPGRRRLFQTGDSYDPGREGSKMVPSPHAIPSQYAELLDWYERWNRHSVKKRIKNDPLLALRGDGRELWADEPADEYVRRIREGWE